MPTDRFRMAIIHPGHNGPLLLHNVIPDLTLDRVKNTLNPIPRVVWNYVNPCGGAIMARMDSSHPEAVSRHPKAQK